MPKQDIHREVKDAFGMLPGFVEQMDDQELEQWWYAQKNFWSVDTALPVKTKALLGLASSATMRCHY